MAALAWRGPRSAGRLAVQACGHLRQRECGRARTGQISRNVVRADWSRVLGSDLLQSVDDSYCSSFLADDGVERRPKGRPGHSPEKIAQALASCAPPDGSVGLVNAVTTFAGYLVLDAWVANQDRHDQNWAVLRSIWPALPLRLAPSYDHASSIGFNLGDDERARWLDRGAVGDFARRARATRFEHDPSMRKSARPSLVDIAKRMLEVAGSGAERLWTAAR